MTDLGVLLRGSTCSGKTEVGRALLRRLGGAQTEPIILDSGWEAGQPRFNGGPQRYRDLREVKDEVIVVELGYGEPAGRGFQGATTNPSEWADVLREEGREILLFRLRADPAELVRRARDMSPPRSPQDASAWHQLYETHPDLLGLPSRLGIVEHVVDTTAISVEKVAEGILKVVRTRSRS